MLYALIIHETNGNIIDAAFLIQLRTHWQLSGFPRCNISASSVLRHCDVPVATHWGEKVSFCPGLKGKKNTAKEYSAKWDACNCCFRRAKIWEPPYGKHRQNASSQTHEMRGENHRPSTLQSETQANRGHSNTLLVIRKRDKYRFKRNFRYVVHSQICTLREEVGWGGRREQGNNITISLVQCMHNRLLFSLCIW